MSVRSKTGLLPSVTKNVRIEIQAEATLDVSGLAVPAPYVLRPFAGVYNPFPYGCSILCNHPADYEAKDVVRKAKDTWASEGRALLAAEDLASLRRPQGRPQGRGAEPAPEDEVPEELFRKYTDTDSRPITPAPTVASVITKNSQVRRCVTPDPVSSLPTRERTLLVLDLRRSHSQDTLSWQGGLCGQSGQASQSVQGGHSTARTGLLQPPATLSARSPSSTGQNTVRRTEKKSKPVKRKGTPSSTPLPTPKGEGEVEEKGDKDVSQKLQHQVLNSVKSLPVPEAAADSGLGDARGSISGDSDVVKRRGKKRRGKKAGRDMMKEGEREVQGLPDPGETQVSALGNDSRAGSTRPSLTPGAGAGDALLDGQDSDRRADRRPSNASFLDPDILKHLQRQLDQEAVDAEFDVKRKIALTEALRSRPSAKPVAQGEEMKALRRELHLPTNCPDKWLHIPRVFTRQSARFELPMDSRSLNTMTPIQYAQNYVFASSERIVLYNHVFNLHREEMDEDEKAERILLGKHVLVALGQIMGRELRPKEALNFQQLMGWTDTMQLDFRTFVGIGAVCERLLARRFCSKLAPHEEDPRHEVERADFESLDRKLLHLSPAPAVVAILKRLRDS